MNVLVVTTSYPSGPSDTAGIFVHRLNRALVRRGHAVRVVAAAKPGACGREVVDGVPVRWARYAASDAGHYLTSVAGGIPQALRRRPGSARQVPLLLAGLAWASLGQGRWADVVHAHWLGSALSAGAVRASAGVPVVLTLHGSDAYLIEQRAIGRLAARWAFHQCHAVTVVSRRLMPLVEPCMPPRRPPVHVTTLGVDLEDFRPSPSPSSAPAGLRGLYVGHITRAKGVDLLIEGLSRCRDFPWTLTLVGDGDDLSAMQSLAASRGIADRLQWRGRLSPTAVPPVMREHDFLLLPSRSEGRPTVILEAMASGLPVIATRVGGVPDLVAHEQTGLLVPPEAVEPLAGAIRRLAEDAPLRVRMGRAARRYMLDHEETMDATAAAFERLFVAATATGASRGS